MKIYTFHSKLFASVSFCVILFGVRSIKAAEKVIIDTDAGADDAVAILLTLKSEETGFEVLAITCSYGNTYVQNVVTNVLKILTIANRSDIPVYKGAQKGLINEYKFNNFFGSDGLGDFNFTEKITAQVDKSKYAAVALIDFVKQYPDQITILSIGPLTNIATAIALEPSFLKHVKNHIILGASVAGVGNVLPNVEFNFSQDPESNYMVLNKTGTSVLFPWETTLDSRIPTEWRKNVLGKTNSTIVNFLNKAEQVSLANSTLWNPSDAMAAAVTLWPELITKSVDANVYPVIDGFAKGSVLVDYINSTGRTKNTKIVQSFDATAFQQLLLSKFS